MSTKKLHYASFDMGSESMAACCQLVGQGKPTNINLQEYAEKLFQPGTSSSQIDFLLKDDGEENIPENRSPRLRTKVSLNNGVQPAKLEDRHAKLEFIGKDGNADFNTYKQSLFQLFLLKDQDEETVMPNPKIPFQVGAQKIIPVVKTSGGGKIQHEPGVLIKHLLVQIIRNLILRSSKLRDIDPGDIHLMLTIPNVYSLTHAESIKKFVKTHSGFGDVDIIYESDAIAYFVQQSEARFQKYKEFTEKMDRRLRNPDDINEYQILTIDIGHGTTDLSLLEILWDKTANVQKRYIKARAGKSDGGSRLNYILARYYDRSMARVFKKFKKNGLSQPFNFMDKEDKGTKSKALAILERLIVDIKKSITGKYIVSLNREKQEKHLNNLADEIAKCVKNKAPADVSDLDVNLEKLKRALRGVLFLKKLPGRFISRLYDGNKWIGKLIPIDIEKMELRMDVENYVAGNVGNLLNHLRGIALKRENNGEGKADINKDENIFVVVGGQASQFQPIRNAIIDELSDWNIDKDYLLFLNGKDAKEACSKGAIVSHEARHTPGNPGELHGTYGIVKKAMAPPLEFRILDTSSLNDGEIVKETFDITSDYWMFYSPAPYKKKESDAGEFFRTFDGSIAWITEVGRNIRIFEVEYDPAGKLLKVNNTEIVETASYGDIHESIYPKTWPIVLKPIHSSDEEN